MEGESSGGYVEDERERIDREEGKREETSRPLKYQAQAPGRMVELLTKTRT